MNEQKNEIVLIGAGIMSATLGVLLKELDPEITITIFESLDSAANESSDAWNNAGTGHSAFCELNYTPKTSGGTVDTSKAIHIAEAFETSRQFWSYLVKHKKLNNPGTFIRPVPHMSFVWGEENARDLYLRYTTMIKHPLFDEMQFSEDREQLKKWIPLIMEGRDQSEKIAATYMEAGTDVNFGELTRQLLKYLGTRKNVQIFYDHEVKNIKRKGSGWRLIVNDKSGKRTKETDCSFVFIGAGGGALPLLKKSKIPESKGYGGFPVSGQWLICKNQAVISKHHVKAYGKARVGTPPMSVPHLDARFILGKKQLLFGPYAGFTTRFLKHGSAFDLIRSIRFNNIIPMIAAGVRNLPLTKYLFDQVKLTAEDRIKYLKEFVPTAKPEEWELAHAGMRVQIIKKDKKKGGVLEFGTELVHTGDGTLAALLGASPGASVSASIMLELLDKCFKEETKRPDWDKKLKEIFISQAEGISFKNSRLETDRILLLNSQPLSGKRI